MKFLWKDSGVIGIIVLALILALGVVISKSQDFVNFRDIGIAAAFVICTLVVTSLVSIVIWQKLLSEWSVQRQELNSSFARLGSRFDAVAKASSADWLCTDLQLQEIEKSVNCGEVWIITASLEEEEAEDQYLPIIRGNLERGLKYIYLIPKHEVLNERIRSFERKLGENLTKNVRFEVISDPLFEIIGMQDMAVYVPCGRTHDAPSAYMNLPIIAGGTTLFIKLGKPQTETLIAHLRKHAQKPGDRAGHKVTVFEQSSIAGGACRNERWNSGAIVSPGANHFGMLASRVIRDMGLGPTDLPVIRADPQLIVGLAEGQSIGLYEDVARTSAEVSRYSSSDAKAIRVGCRMIGSPS